MIKRYLINEIEDIWNQNNKISTWIKVESSVTKQLEDAGIVPKGLSAEILKVNISLEELEEREKITNHDVASFVDILQNKIQKNSEWVHYGLTSSDIVDTSNSLLIIESLDFLLIQIDELIETLIAAPDRKSLITRTRALDRVMQWGHYIIPHWHLNYDRLIFWSKLKHPKTTPLKGRQFDTWWINPKSFKKTKNTQKFHKVE